MRYRFFFFFAAAVVALGIGGCGGEGKSSDPLGTDKLEFGDSSGGSVLQLDPNGVVQLTAKVTDAAGKEVAEREVFFDIFPNASGATININKVVTNTAGEAPILYRAGAVSGSDVVRAFISNGARRDVSITVGGGAGGVKISLAAAPTSLAAGENSILTATVTNAAGTPIKDQPVTFSFIGGTAPSGATLTPINNGITDISGRALAIYSAGFDNPTLSVPDTVLAGATGTAAVVIITRLAGSVTGSRISSLTADPASLLARNGTSIVTATVVQVDGVTTIPGVPVTFSLVKGLGTVLPQTVVTNNSGQASAVFTGPGGAESGFEAVQAQILGATGGSAVVIISWP